MGLLRTILRRAFYSAAAVSTLLLLATLILWPVSHYQWVCMIYSSRTTTTIIGGMRGRAMVEYLSPTGNTLGVHFSAVENPSGTIWSYFSMQTGSFLGLNWATIPAPIVMYLAIPFSYLTLLFSILPLLAFRSIRRRRRAQRVGLCPKCGYDLRAQRAGAGGAVCPECGTPVAGRGPSPGGREALAA